MDVTQFGKVAVLMGGTSAEREVSLRSGQAVLEALQSQSVDAHAVDVDANFNLADLSVFDRVFIVLHGRGGEDGTMQGALETLSLPYTGSRVLGSALGMDKFRCKLLWQSAGLSTPQYRRLTPETDLQQVVAELGLPLMIKPAHEGSSIGISKVTEAEQIQAAFDEAWKYDELVFAEQWITGSEYTASILNDEALPMIKLETPHGFYDYAAKYQSDDTQYLCPCGLDEASETKIQQLALQAFDLVGCSGWGRVDFMIDKAGTPWLIEVNTVPGMTDHSLVPMAARQSGRSMQQLVLEILETSL